MSNIKKDVRYLNKDFSEFRNNLIEFSRTYFPNTYADFNEASPGMLFIEQASYVGDILSYYLDYQLNEYFVDYATYKPNLINNASDRGYKVKNKVPAIAELDVFQLLPAKTTVNGKEPDWSYALTLRENMVVSAPNFGVEFRTLAPVNFASSGSFDPTIIAVHSVNENDGTPEFYTLQKRVMAIAGNVNVARYQFNEAKRYDKILLEDTDIIEVVSIVDSDNNVWQEVPNLAQETVFESILNTSKNDPELSQFSNVQYLLKLKKTVRRFTTRFRADENLVINFGSGTTVDFDEEIIPNPDNVGLGLQGMQTQVYQPIDPSNFLYSKAYGLAPSNTTLTVTYTTGGGISSNVPSNTINDIVSVNIEIDDQFLDPVLLNSIKGSIACTNPSPASGGKDEESDDDIRENTKAFFSAQNRAVTPEDYAVRAYCMPPRYGSVAKVYVVTDADITVDDEINNFLAVNMYTLGYNADGSLTNLNKAVKENLKNYISQYKLLTTGLNIKNAYIINIGIKFEIITTPDANSQETLLRCIERLKFLFDNKKMQINQPIIISKLLTELDRIKGVQTVSKLELVNLYDSAAGYSGNVYDIKAATKDNIVYPSLDPSIFEIKFPNKDIVGRVISI